MHWRTIEDAVRYYLKEGYRVARCRCEWCEHFETKVIHPDSTIDRFECSQCGRMTQAIVREYADESF